MLKYNKHIITLLMVLIMPALVSGCVVKPSDDYNLTEDKTTASSTEATTEGGKSTAETTTESGTTAASDSGAGTTATTNAPKTGDESCPWIYIILLVMACGGMAGCSVYDRITLRRK